MATTSAPAFINEFFIIMDFDLAYDPVTGQRLPFYECDTDACPNIFRMTDHDVSCDAIDTYCDWCGQYRKETYLASCRQVVCRDCYQSYTEAIDDLTK